MNRLPEKCATNFITTQIHANVFICRYLYRPCQTEGITREKIDWESFFSFSSSVILNTETKSIFTPIRTYFNISSLGCDDVFHHFSILHKLKIHASLCLFTSVYLCVCAHFACVCNLIWLCLRNFKIEMINFRYATTFSGGGTQRVRKRIWWVRDTGCYGTRCYVQAPVLRTEL